ncbi:MAG TPA: hypothetical protein VEB20_01295 [Azospirillaceae bacterium]|nr:hypothetical protein [Azospirillaceae bacterium]
MEPNLVETHEEEGNPGAGRRPWTAPVLMTHAIDDITRNALTNNHDASNSQS